MDIIVNPATEHIKAEIEQLRKEFLDLFTLRDYMLSTERDDIYIRYVNLIGQAKYENFSLMVEVRALKMKCEYAQAAVSRNERPDVAEIQRRVDIQLKDYYKIVEEQVKAIKEAQEAVVISKFDDKELKDLYRVIVKRLHPDLHPDLPPEQAEKMKDLFIKGQAAYHTHNIQLLREIVMCLDMNDDLDSMLKKSEETLSQTRDRLRQQVQEMRADIDNLNKTFPFTLRDLITDPEWVTEQQEQLSKEREELEALKKIYTERFELLTDL